MYVLYTFLNVRKFKCTVLNVRSVTLSKILRICKFKISILPTHYLYKKYATNYATVDEKQSEFHFHSLQLFISIL